MLRVDFDQQLNLLQQEVEIVEKAINRKVDSLKRRDLEETRQVVQDDDYINQKRFEIEERCVDLIATQQPMAGDLRVFIALLNIVVELERMGDYAESIARISLAMGDASPLKSLIDVPRMAEKATELLPDSIDSLRSRDIGQAHQACQADDEVDALYDQFYRELLFFVLQDAQSIQRATYLLWVSHDLEGIADRATNIAERAIFLVTGKMTEINVSKY